VNIEKLKPGMVVCDIRRYKMGNTTMSSVGVWPVTIISVDEAKQTVTASWNNNPPRLYYHGDWSKWRLSQPTLVKTVFGAYRLQTREEKKQAATPL
jgi:hypothetical protein